MRVDVLTIFPEYLAPLDLSLIGRARRAGLLDIRVRDLRDYAHDRHRSVDDTPYGGGAGMVMKAEPWAEALDSVLADRSDAADSTAAADPADFGPGAAGAAGPHLILPGPGGEPFTQQLAHELAAEPWLVFACGRYEGIDERVYEHARETFEKVSVISLGDYVLNGGEVATLAMIEAVARLLPGVVGNAESLVEESHEGGLLEYPVFTKPASWRGRDVPEVLRGGDHAAIAHWRLEQRRRRTAERRPDLLAASEIADVRLRRAVAADAAELHVLTRACWVSEAQANEALDIPPLVETLEELRASLGTWQTWVGVADGRIVASVRARRDPVEPTSVWEIGRMMVAPDRQREGLGRRLLEFAEAAAPAEVATYSLFTGVGSARNLRLYRRCGYRPRPATAQTPPGVVVLHKRRR